MFGSLDNNSYLCDIKYNAMEEKRYPIFGPFTDEEAIARIEEAEADLKDPSKWITAEEMDRRLYERFPWLR